MAQAVNPLSLFELNESIKNAIALSMPKTIWLKAEILEMNRHFSSGHCYFELVEKDKKTDKTIARARATMWAYSARMLEPYFKSVTGKPLQEGMNVLLNVTVEYSEIYGLSLNIKDIDPVYTIGDMEMQKKAIIKQLEDEGVMEMNKSVEFPLVPQKIAVVSSETAAGWGDFKQQLLNNPYRFRFECTLFPALMQGNGTEQSVVDALERIYEQDGFDVVAIIRGGGSKADLGAFDNYRIAYYISQFPIPVLTGIGHDRDESVADLVAAQALKTPTAVAEFIIARVEDFAHQIDEAERDLTDMMSSYFEKQKDLLELLSNRTHRSIKAILNKENDRLNYAEKEANIRLRHRLQQEKSKLNHYQSMVQSKLGQSLKVSHFALTNFESRLKQAMKSILKNKRLELEQAEKQVKLLDPRNLTKRGYALMVQKGKVIKDIDDIDPDVPLISMMNQGDVVSQISEIRKRASLHSTNVE